MKSLDNYVRKKSCMNKIIIENFFIIFLILRVTLYDIKNTKNLTKKDECSSQ